MKKDLTQRRNDRKENKMQNFVSAISAPLREPFSWAGWPIPPKVGWGHDDPLWS
jgi:hypothetical protein